MYSYGVVCIYSKNLTTEGCGCGDNPLYIGSQNVAGELFGAIAAFEETLDHHYKKLKIYHDYEGVAKWITGEWKPKVSVAKYYVDTYNEKFKDKIHVEFVKVPAHANISYNERADKLAKSILSEHKNNSNQ